MGAPITIISASCNSLIQIFNFPGHVFYRYGWINTVLNKANQYSQSLIA